MNIGVLDYVAERIAPGITTEQIDQWVHDYTVEHGAIPAPLDYEGFPEVGVHLGQRVVCHGIPSPDEVLRGRPIVSIDCSTIRTTFLRFFSHVLHRRGVAGRRSGADLVRV